MPGTPGSQLDKMQPMLVKNNWKWTVELQVCLQSYIYENTININKLICDFPLCSSIFFGSFVRKIDHCWPVAILAAAGPSHGAGCIASWLSARSCGGGPMGFTTCLVNFQGRMKLIQMLNRSCFWTLQKKDNIKVLWFRSRSQRFQDHFDCQNRSEQPRFLLKLFINAPPFH